MTSSPARRAAALLLSLSSMLLATAPARAAAPTVQLEDLSWTELRERIAAGSTTALVPVGGTEQNGPHMVLGKHNVRVRWLAARIAQQLGDAVVAPVLAYVPEGRIKPPAGHMRWPGTLSIPEPAFEAVLAGAARSLQAHGFCHVFFLGDHGGYKASLERVAAALNREGAAGSRCRAHALGEYYHASQADFEALLKSRGHAAAEIGPHAGLADTSLALAVDPSLVRMEVARARPRGRVDDGVAGDPRAATAELGRLGIDHIVEVSVAAIRQRRLDTKP
ncbi:Creatininase [Rubrivivax sp. A210]|uniref:creatininase family protein n=1 Tax=Rubrivivax sp. A210 TaxID=2772301 RepID=UPI001918FF1A|nr:creatininase family protein [Rubrivivax sp. A210]CAD5372838.1 Creatininase [Rubrivivax sp. A210]